VPAKSRAQSAAPFPHANIGWYGLAAFLVCCLTTIVSCAEASRTPVHSPAHNAGGTSQDLGPPPGAWYLRLASRSHLPLPDVGPLPYSRDSGAWLSTVNDPEPTRDEFSAFHERASTVISGFWAERHLETTDRPYLPGDYFGYRSEELLFDRAKLSAHALEMRDLLLTLQKFLARPENVRWRLGYFDDEDSLIVYPSTIIIGQRSLGPSQLLAPLENWLVRPRRSPEDRRSD